MLGMSELKVCIMFLPNLLLLFPVFARGETIEGQVVNESRGGKPVKDAELVLHQVDGNIVKKIMTDQKGQFTLEVIEGDPEDEYHLLLQYEGMEYTTEHFPLTEPRDLKISVYDSTHNEGEVKVEAHHLILEVQNRELVVTEIIILHKSGEKAFAGEIEIPLPEGAFNPEFLEGIRVVETSGRYYDDQGIKPGSKEMVLRYHLKTPSRKARLSFPLHFSTSLFSLLVSDPGLTVESGQLSPSEIQKIGDRDYLSLIGRDLSKGSVVEVEIAGFSGNLDFAGKIIFGGTLFLVLVGIGLTIQKRRRDRATPEDLLERKGFFVSTLSKLEDGYKKGKLSKGFYEEMNSYHRKRLRRVLEELDNHEKRE